MPVLRIRKKLRKRYTTGQQRRKAAKLDRRAQKRRRINDL